MYFNKIQNPLRDVSQFDTRAIEMTGAYLKGWMEQNKKTREEIAFRLGITTNTLFRWFKEPELDKGIVLALAQLGCREQGQESQTQKASAQN